MKKHDKWSISTGAFSEISALVQARMWHPEDVCRTMHTVIVGKSYSHTFYKIEPLQLQRALAASNLLYSGQQSLKWSTLLCSSPLLGQSNHKDVYLVHPFSAKSTYAIHEHPISMIRNVTPNIKLRQQNQKDASTHFSNPQKRPSGFLKSEQRSTEED